MPLSQSRAVWKFYALTLRRSFLPLFQRAICKAGKVGRGGTLCLAPDVCTYYHMGSPHRKNYFVVKRWAVGQYYSFIVLSAARRLPMSRWCGGSVCLALFFSGMLPAGRPACLTSRAGIRSLPCSLCLYIIYHSTTIKTRWNIAQKYNCASMILLCIIYNCTSIKYVDFSGVYILA